MNKRNNVAPYLQTKKTTNKLERITLLLSWQVVNTNCYRNAWWHIRLCVTRVPMLYLVVHLRALTFIYINGYLHLDDTYKLSKYISYAVWFREMNHSPSDFVRRKSVIYLSYARLKSHTFRRSRIISMSLCNKRIRMSQMDILVRVLVIKASDIIACITPTWCIAV